MAEQHSGEGSGTGGASVSDSDSTLELKIKTLDSQIYTFHVDKNMPISSFKGKIADQVGVPTGQQRLIFRGKVLKDEHLLSEYHVENGDTLHLVERQPVQLQSSGAEASGNNASQGTDAGVPRNRIGQISHSVVLGTFNVGDQGEAAVPDLTRVIGAVLNSLGVASQPTLNGSNGVAVHAAAPTNHSAAASQGNNTEQVLGSAGAPVQASSPFGQPFLSQPLHVPLMGGSVNPSSLNMPIPDSLSTLSEFINRMEEVLSSNGYQPTPSSTGSADQPVTELPSNARGFPTPEALSVILRQTQRLLSGQAVSALSHIAARLEQEGGSTDASVRSQIQSDSVQAGLAMQHFGALFLEIGRTLLMLRMGQSPAEGAVNSGPAVYISQSGPNPIMVQPFPHQTSPLFNPPASAPNSGVPIPVGIVGSAPRNINIHIHAGTSVPAMVSAVGTRGAGGDGALGDRGGVNAAGDSGAARMFPIRNVIATAVPSRSATIAVTPVTSGSQPIGGVSTSQPPEATALVSEVNTRIRSFLENMQAGSQPPIGQLDNSNSSVGPAGGVVTSDPSSIHSGASVEASQSRGSILEQSCEDSVSQRCSAQSSNVSPSMVEPSPSCASGVHIENSEPNLKDHQTSGDSSTSSGARDVPLGLGGGLLQPKRRGQLTKKSSGIGTSSGIDQSQQARASGQQVLQSLLSQSTAGNSSDVSRAGQTGQGFRQDLATTRSGTEGQLDVTGMMSQVLDNPALNGLLSGVAQQTGVGSPDMLRNMLQQFTQNPAMMNTVNQLAEQVDRDEVRSMFGGTGAGQGSLDLSSMVQQMMPVVSQFLGGASFQNDQEQNLVPQLLPQVSRRSIETGDDSSLGQSFQSYLQGVVQQIGAQSSSEDIFRAVVQATVEVCGMIDVLVAELSSNQELVDLFMETLRSDLLRRVYGAES